MGFRVLRTNQEVYEIRMNRGACGPGKQSPKDGRRLPTSCCQRRPSTAGRTEQRLQLLPSREASS